MITKCISNALKAKNVHTISLKPIFIKTNKHAMINAYDSDVYKSGT